MLRVFIGREGELEMLDEMWQSAKAELIILYGRRRIGKTRLLTHWMQKHQSDGLYWMAEPSSSLDQLRSFSQALANFTDPDDPAPLNFTYATWEQAFKQVALLARDKRFALFIDEITYLMDTNPNIIGTLQKTWDHRLSKANLVLALSGSQMGLVQEDLISYDAPLYGRATVQLRLDPLPFGATGLYFPEYDAAERVLLYAILGGVPAYWERIESNKSIIENLLQQLRPSNPWMLDEPRILLQDFLNDLNNYVGIMRAMAQGSHTLAEIGKQNGLHSTHMSGYLRVLRDTEFVQRLVPVTQFNTKSRRGRYYVVDPYLRFYYRFLASYRSKLAMGQRNQVLQTIETNLDEFIQFNTWREICQEWLLRASGEGAIPLDIETAGSEWRHNFFIDVAGIRKDEKNLVLGCTLWRDEPGTLKDLMRIVDRTSSIVQKGEKWNLYYLGFSRSGWSQADIETAALKIRRKVEQGRSNWKFAGLRLLDLETVDSDLATWTTQQQKNSRR